MTEYIDRISVILAIFLVGLGIIISTSDFRSINIGALLIVALSFIFLLREYIVYCKDFITDIKPESSKELREKADERIKKIFPLSWWITSIFILIALSMYLQYFMNMFIASAYVLIMATYLVIIIYSFRYSVLLLYRFRDGVPAIWAKIFYIFLIMMTIPLTIITLMGLIDVHLPISQLYTPLNITHINETYTIIKEVNSTNAYNTSIDNYMLKNNVIYLSIAIGLISVIIYLIYLGSKRK